MARTIHPAKRAFDVIFSLFFFVVLAPFVAVILIALVIEHTLRGRPLDPLFYSEVRLSAGVPFMLYKFNIFRNDVIAQMRVTNTFIHTKDLERNGGISTVGWCLKQIYMDELPQLWCVLHGDMSIVGPRPVNTEAFESLIQRGFTDKLRVHAGLTGPFQSLRDDQIAPAVRLDREYADYVETHSGVAIILHDLRIIFRTLLVVLNAKGI